MQAKNDEFPGYIVELPKIRQLDVPVPFLEKLDAKKYIPKHLETLIITANDIYITKNSKYPAFPVGGLEHLKGLVLDTDPKLNLVFDDDPVSSNNFRN